MRHNASFGSEDNSGEVSFNGLKSSRLLGGKDVHVVRADAFIEFLRRSNAPDYCHIGLLVPPLSKTLATASTGDIGANTCMSMAAFSKAQSGAAKNCDRYASRLQSPTLVKDASKTSRALVATIRTMSPVSNHCLSAHARIITSRLQEPLS